jgi:hypothetical protein
VDIGINSVVYYNIIDAEKAELRVENNRNALEQ